jgi:hypothetical protein
MQTGLLNSIPVALAAIAMINAISNLVGFGTTYAVGAIRDATAPLLAVARSTGRVVGRGWRSDSLDRLLRSGPSSAQRARDGKQRGQILICAPFAEQARIKI